MPRYRMPGARALSSVRDLLEMLGLAAVALVALARIHVEPTARRDGVGIVHPWAKGAAGRGTQIPIYVTFTNDGALDDRLIRIETGSAKTATLTRIDLREGLVRPVELEALNLPSKTRISLRPGERQITLAGLMDPVEPGSSIAVTFVFERAGRLSAKVRVENFGEPEHEDHV